MFGLVTLAFTVGIYWYVRDALTERATTTLADYVRLRSERESQIFLQAQRNVAFLAREYEQALRRAPPADTAREFDRLFVRFPDGAHRRRPETLRINEESGAFLAPGVALNDEAKWHLLTVHRLTTTYGRAWQDTSAKTFLASIDGLFATYWPGVDWAQETPADPEFLPLPWVAIKSRVDNPARGPAWTGVWYDWIGKRWAVTCFHPIDVDGGFRHYAGASLFLEDILQRTSWLGLNGTYNIIFRGDGRLISHPDHTDAINASNGEFNIVTDGNPHLRAIYHRVTASRGVSVLDLSDYGQYIGVGRIVGPDWYFVTVLPKTVVTGALKNAAILVLVVGACALLLELLVLAWIIRRQVGRRLRPVLRATQQIADGVWSVRVPEGEDDELGALSRAFNTMAKEVGDRDARLERYTADLEAAVAARTAELERAVAAADVANRTNTRLLAAASHDLRQPAYALGLLVNVLERHAARQAAPGPEFGAVIAKLKSTLAGLDHLLSAILDISRLDANAVRPDVRPTDISLILHALAGEFGEACQEKQLALRVVPTTLWGMTDPDLLRDMLRNLLSNALRYTERGKILLGCRRRGESVEIQVLDTGIGIRPEDQEAIFTEFYQVGNVERNRAKGLGLGLAIVDRLSRLLDHPVSMRSMPCKGSRFSMRMPRAKAPPASTFRPPAKLIEHAIGGTVMVIDDDYDVRTALDTTLSAWGYRTLLAASVDEALALASTEKNSIACILADYRLPGEVTGSEAIRQIVATIGRSCPAFVVTGDTSPDRLRETSACAYRVLHKPLDADELEALVAAAVAAGVAGLAPADAPANPRGAER